MVNQQLLDYIKQQLQQNISREQIKNSLITNGWQALDIDEAFSSMVSSNQPLTPTDTLLQSQSFSTQPSRGLNKTLLVRISIICGILIIGGGVFAYFNYFQSPESPEKIVQKMTAKLTEIKSLEYSGEIKAELPGPGNENSFLFNINFTGKSDTQNLKDIKSLFFLNGKTDKPYFNVETETFQRKKSTFGLEARTISEIVYINFSELPESSFDDLSDEKKQWIKFKKEGKKQKLSLKQIEKLKIAVQQAKIFKTIEKLTDEKIENINTYHYKFTLDKEGIINLISDISDIRQNKSEYETLELKERLAEFSENFEVQSEGEIWIGKKDLLPYKITLSSIIDKIDESESGIFSNSFTILLKNFNKPVQIEIPQQARLFPTDRFFYFLFGI